jgi:hypothetical protein
VTARIEAAGAAEADAVGLAEVDAVGAAEVDAVGAAEVEAVGAAVVDAVGAAEADAAGPAVGVLLFVPVLVMMTSPCRSRSLVRFGVVEDVVEGDPEDVGDLERHLERGRVAPLLDGDHGLTGDTDAVGKGSLGHLALIEAERTDAVGDASGLHHGWNPRR